MAQTIETFVYQTSNWYHHGRNVFVAVRAFICFWNMNFLLFVIIMSFQPRIILSRPLASTPSPNPAPSPIPIPRLKQSCKWNRFQSPLIKSVHKTESNKKFKYQVTLYFLTSTITVIKLLWIEEVIGWVKSFHVSLGRFLVSLYGYGKMVSVVSTILLVIEIFNCNMSYFTNTCL